VFPLIWVKASLIQMAPVETAAAPISKTNTTRVMMSPGWLKLPIAGY
jgi:hypothetical protein